MEVYKRAKTWHDMSVEDAKVETMGRTFQGTSRHLNERQVGH